MSFVTVEIFNNYSKKSEIKKLFSKKERITLYNEFDKRLKFLIKYTN